MKTLSILGSTGSIGTQTLDIVRKNPKEYKVIGLTANKNIELLKKQVDEFRPEAVCVMDEEKADGIKADIPVYKGMAGLIKIATLAEANTVVNSLVGSIGVLPTAMAIKEEKNIALANKEALVTAGKIITKLVSQYNVSLMPIDSEHSAIFQCLNGENIKEMNKVTITCSGGAFKNKTKGELENVTAADALKHPTWDMGAKITIDCATLMNKGFEVIEAHWLYGLDYDKIDVVLHPESIIHSLVEFNDHSVMAQLGVPSMKLPIQYALTYPMRIKNPDLPRLDLVNVSQLNFKKINDELFPCLKYAYDSGKIGGTLPAVMNAANEIAVQAFLNGEIKFLDIPMLIKKKMDEHKVIKEPDLDDVLAVDKKVKEETKELINK